MIDGQIKDKMLHRKLKCTRVFYDDRLSRYAEIELTHSEVCVTHRRNVAAPVND